MNPLSEVEVEMPGKRVLLCDDDALVRGVVRRLMEDVGYEIVAEADSPDDAVAAMNVGQIDLAVLDLALRSGHGEHLLATLRKTHPATAVVIFSAYVSDPGQLLDDGATAVIEKPHFDRLESVLVGLLEQNDVERERRRPPMRALTPLPRPASTTLSGLEPWTSFTTAVEAARAGDIILAFDVLPNAELRDLWDDVYRIDYRLAIARAVSESRRPHDRLSIASGGLPVLLIVGGHPEAGTAVFERIEGRWRRETIVGYPAGVYTYVGEETDNGKLLNTVLAEMHNLGDHVEQSLRMV